MKLNVTRIVLEQYKDKYPTLSPATIYDALDDHMSQSVDLSKLSELLSALLQDIEGKEIEDMA